MLGSHTLLAVIFAVLYTAASETDDSTYNNNDKSNPTTTTGLRKRSLDMAKIEDLIFVEEGQDTNDIISPDSSGKPKHDRLLQAFQVIGGPEIAQSVAENGTVVNNVTGVETTNNVTIFADDEDDDDEDEDDEDDEDDDEDDVDILNNVTVVETTNNVTISVVDDVDDDDEDEVDDEDDEDEDDVDDEDDEDGGIPNNTTDPGLPPPPFEPNNLIEVAPFCIPYDADDMVAKRSDNFTENEDSCRTEDGPWACGQEGGCCRNMAELTCDTQNLYNSTPCVCNQNTRTPERGPLDEVPTDFGVDPAKATWCRQATATTSAGTGWNTWGRLVSDGSLGSVCHAAGECAETGYCCTSFCVCADGAANPGECLDEESQSISVGT